MSRPLRIEYEDAYYHVMNRGAGRRNVFHDERYFSEFLKSVEEACNRFNIEIHAYCLLDNHYHLLIKTPDANLGRAMRHINGVYTQRYNKLKKTDGPLFRGRYKAIVVDSDAYFLELSKYIHRNPLEAGITSKLEEYNWSSYPYYVGRMKSPSWLIQFDVLKQFNTDKGLKPKYRKFVEETAVDQAVLDFYGKERVSPVLGDEDFKKMIYEVMEEQQPEMVQAEIAALRPSIDSIVTQVASQYGVSEDELKTVKRGRGMKNFPRRVCIYLAQQRGGYKLKEIAEYFGYANYSGVSSSIAIVKKVLETDRKLQRFVDSI